MTARVGCLGASVLGALFFGLFATYALRPRVWEPLPPPNGRPASDAQRFVQQERDVAAALGMTLAEDGAELLPQAARGWQRELRVGARECVAVVASTSGHAELTRLALARPALGGTGLAEVVSDGGSSPALQVQWCSLEDSVLTVRGELALLDQDRRPEYASATVHFAILRAPRSALGARSLNRGVLSGSALSAMGRAHAAQSTQGAEALLPAGAVSLGPGVVLREGAARLLPPSRGGYSVLAQLSARDAGVAVHPRVDLAPVENGGAWNLPRGVTAAELGADTSTAEHDPLVDEGRNDFRRVLLVLDPSSLPGPCTALVFARAVTGVRARVYRFDPATWRATALDAREHLVADRRCTREGPAAWVTYDTDQEDYTVFAATAQDTPEAPDASAP